MWARKDVLESLLVASIGAAGMIGLTISIDGHALSDAVGSRHDLRPLAASLFAGAVVGFAFDLAFKLMKALETAVERLNSLHNLLEIEGMPFELLKRARRQQAVLVELLKHSIAGQRVARVGRPQYLRYLQDALKGSRKFQGIHRLPIRSFFEGALPGSATKEDAIAYREYLNLVGAVRIPRVRLFIIDDKAAMEDDLKNKELLTQYWQETGNVPSYWIEAGRLRRLFPEFDYIPESFVLFDSALLIKYNEDLQTLEFDVVDERARERRLFDQCLTDKPGPRFERIPARP